LIFSSPLLAGGRRIDGPASLADIPPALLGLLGISAPRAGVGCDILDPTDCRPERFVFSWDDEGERITVATASRIYHAHVLAGGPSEPEVFEDEMLIDPVADPGGKLDLVQSDPQSLAALRRGARVYLEVYPWVVAEGRSGTPPSGATSRLQ
jgi:arylsulfatase A-like enzyme